MGKVILAVSAKRGAIDRENLEIQEQGKVLEDTAAGSG